MTDYRKQFSIEERMARLQESGQRADWTPTGVAAEEMTAPDGTVVRYAPQVSRVKPRPMATPESTGILYHYADGRASHYAGEVTTGPGMVRSRHGARIAKGALRFRPSGGMLPSEVRRANGGM